MSGDERQRPRFPASTMTASSSPTGETPTHDKFASSEKAA